MSSSTGNTAATSDMTNVASTNSRSIPTKNTHNSINNANPSSSTARGIDANGQVLTGADSQNAGAKMSKAKKKNQGRKRAKKAAQAKQAAENAGASF